jgi:hypothetical protein
MSRAHRQLGERRGADGTGGEGGTGGGDGGSGGGALLPFMSPCAQNSDCESMLCFHFNTKGSHCTKPCMVDTDCPPPSPGCSAMGVCKAP